ncbi:hypothetical protein [Streptomyces gobiensis]|uniref:hypothetical protein n=1 Tax=Streptomyces gobiensis TaxID=2875706 RepID=UPI001E468015|nr:hypothetical protein [Streptomyces gobiensis]UGY91551.1 hypothetical protein test1122_07310 [Streptomyces gobiensis]
MNAIGKALCGVHSPGWQGMPCLREAGHAGAHRDALAVIASPELEYALSVLFAAEQLRELLGEGSAP